MNKKNTKFVKKNKYSILAVAIGLALLVGGIGVVKADVSFWDKVAQYVGMSIADRVDIPDMNIEEIEFGAFPGPDVYQKMYFHDGFVGNATFHQELNWSGGTTTPSGGESLVLVPAAIRNDSNENLICNNVWLDIATERGMWSGLLAVGTTTETGDVTYTNTSTATLIASTDFATTTSDILSKEDDEGGNTDEFWTWAAGEYIIVSDTFTLGNATSSDSFLASGGFTGDGTLYVNCWFRNTSTPQ